MEGGPGDDEINWSSGAFNDTVSYSSARRGIRADLELFVGSGGGSGQRHSHSRQALHWF